MTKEFLRYVGPPDLHDAVVRAVEHRGKDAVVRVRGTEGNEYCLVFRGVRAVRANRAESMILYALAELTSDGPMRRFTFVNWDEESDASLHVEACELYIEASAARG